MDNISIEDAREYHAIRFDLEYPDIADSDLNKAQLSVLYGEYGSRYIRENFPQYLLQNVVGLFTTMFGPSRFFIYEVSPNAIVANTICLIYTAYLAFIYILYLSGMILNRKKINIVHIFILLLCGYLAVASASLGYSRFREAFFLPILLSAISNSSIIVERVSTILNNRNASKVKEWLTS